MPTPPGGYFAASQSFRHITSFLAEKQNNQWHLEAVLFVMATRTTAFVDVSKLLGLNQQCSPLAVLANADLKDPKRNPNGRSGEHC